MEPGLASGSRWVYRDRIRTSEFAAPSPHMTPENAKWYKATITTPEMRCKALVMSEMPWVRFFPSDWLGGTRALSAAETGIYITLIATMYERGSPIAFDATKLARLCGASNSSFRAALTSLIADGKIIETEAGLWNERVAKEVVYRQEKSDVGSRAAKAKWDKKRNEINGNDDALAMHSQSDRNANQKPEPDAIKKDINPLPPKRGRRVVLDDPELEREFLESIIGEYPKSPHTLMSEARRAYAALPKSKRVSCMRGIARYSMQFEEKYPNEAERLAQCQYVMGLHKWIKKSAWEDYLV